MASTRNEKPASLNYLWIGPPPEFPNGIPGHDIAGPIRMAQCAPQNKVTFWCLKAHSSAYQEKLSKYGIEVKSVEDHLEATLNHNDTRVKSATIKCKEILDTCLKQNSVRANVTLKEALSPYLAYTCGGFVLDTGVKPIVNADQRILFFPSPDREKFTIPVNYLPPAGLAVVRPEVWLVSSHAYSLRPYMSFMDYYDSWKSFTNEYANKSEKDIDLYEMKHQLGSMIVNALYMPEDQESEYIEYDYRGPSAIISSLGIRKYYFGTHAPANYPGGSTRLEKALVDAIDEIDMLLLEDLLNYSIPVVEKNLMKNILTATLQYATAANDARLQPLITLLSKHRANFIDEKKQQPVITTTNDSTLKAQETAAAKTTEMSAGTDRSTLFSQRLPSDEIKFKVDDLMSKLTNKMHRADDILKILLDGKNHFIPNFKEFFRQTKNKCEELKTLIDPFPSIKIKYEEKIIKYADRIDRALGQIAQYEKARENTQSKKIK